MDLVVQTFFDGNNLVRTKNIKHPVNDLFFGQVTERNKGYWIRITKTNGAISAGRFTVFFQGCSPVCGVDSTIRTSIPIGKMTLKLSNIPSCVSNNTNVFYYFTGSK